MQGGPLGELLFPINLPSCVHPAHLRPVFSATRKYISGCPKFEHTVDRHVPRPRAYFASKGRGEKKHARINKDGLPIQEDQVKIGNGCYLRMFG